MENTQYEAISARDLDSFISYLGKNRICHDIGQVISHVQRYAWMISNGEIIGYTFKNDDGNIMKRVLKQF